MKSIASLALVMGLAACSSSEPGESASFNVVTNGDDPLKIVAIGDLNGMPGDATYSGHVRSAVRWIVEHRPDLVLMPGDLISVDGVGSPPRYQTEAEIRTMWEGFERTVLQPLNDAGIPYAFAFGNHDHLNELSRKGARDFWTPTRKAATRLAFADDAEFPFRYSFTMKSSVFFAWDTNTHYVSSANRAFAERALSTDQARAAKFRVGIAHFPLFGMAEARNNASETIADYLPLKSFLRDNHVSVYLTGHQHAFYPAEVDGIRFVHNGCLGGGKRQLLGSAAPAYEEFTTISLDPNATDPITVKGFYAKTQTLVPRSTLPDEVVGFDGRTAPLDPSYGLLPD